MKPRPPYRAATVVGFAVLLGYVFSLAPSVTFWDAGEFIGAMKTLGIPHPPGTPLFVMLGHVWGNLIPVGEFAWRTNLMSATFSAAGAAFWFLVLHEILVAVAGEEDANRVWRIAGAAAGAIIAAFTFTNWQNSNETEVYAVAGFIIALCSWLCLRWRSARGTDREPKILLLIAYLLGVSIANHLLALLAGPAVILFLMSVLRHDPAADPLQRRREWGYAAVFAGLWALLLGAGLGSPTLILLGGLAFVGALVVAVPAGALPFAIVALLVAAVGVTPYLFLYIRSGQHPMLNEAAPSTWSSLLAMVRREQYGIRTPFDDPTQYHGPENPGRNLTLIGLQLANYFQYFDWQWAKSWATTVADFPLRTLITLVAGFLGLQGLFVHRRADRSSWWLLFGMFLVTGLGLVAYMNFKPGYSLAWKLYPDQEQHEVRERDYFFVISFVIWALWIGVGLTQLGRALAARLSDKARAAALGVLALALVPPILNFKEADRGHGPDARLPGDFAYDLLNSVPPYGILFTYGDNDTFPLWWAQEVEGIRPDVAVVCIALARTEWYMAQMRTWPVRPFDEARAPAYWRGRNPQPPTRPLHTMTNDDIARAVPQLLPRDAEIAIGPYRTTLKANSPLYPEDFLKIRVLQQNFGHRPIVWGLTAAGQYYGLDPIIVQRGLGLNAETGPIDSTQMNRELGQMFRAAVDLKATEKLAYEVYRYGHLLDADHGELETTARGIAATLAVPFTQLASDAEARQDFLAMVKHLERAARLWSNPSVVQGLAEARKRLPTNRK
ncbi:MAG: DUF2723 domain-containing protein [Gemmatimonadota bacterium]